MVFFYIVFGLIIGSFLNAVIYRLYAGQSIVIDRSFCPHCKHVLQAMDLVPVFSFIFLGGRCRYCGKKISWQYPAVEIMTTAVFVLVGFKFGFMVSEAMLFSLVAACYLIVIAVFDLKHYLILDVVVMPASVIAFLHLLYMSFNQHNFSFHSPLLGGIFGAFIISGFFWLQYMVSGGRWIGFGDVKLGIFLGLLFGVGQGIMLLFVSYLLGAVVGLSLVSLGHKQLSGKLPFGTILGFSAIIMLLYGPSILASYLGMLGL